MKIFFVVIPSISYGERQHAIGMINQLRNSNFELVLLVEPLLEDTFKNINIKTYTFYNSFDFELFYKKENPDMFIFFEYTNCPVRIREKVSKYNKPILTTLGSGVGGIQSYKDHFIELFDDKKNFNLSIIKPCPVASPDIDTEFVKHWSLFKDLDITKYDRKKTNSDFNIREDSKIVFLSVATWICDNLKRSNQLYIYEFLFSLVLKALLEIKQNTDFFVISPFGEKYVEREHVRVRMMNFLDYETYDNLLMTSDLVISENVMQASMSKAFVGGINCLALINSKMMQQPFNLAPYDVLSAGQMYDNSNNYYKALEKAEISDLNEVTNKISNLLNNKNNLLRDLYLNDLKKLSSLENILFEVKNRYSKIFNADE